MKHTLIISLLIFGFLSCEKVDNVKSYKGNEGLKGVWVYRAYQDSIAVYSSEAQLDEDLPGFMFFDSAKFIERKNAGWCGTPPIAYSNYNGTWNNTDSLVNITVGYWGGMASYKWIVMSLTTDTLKIYNQAQTYTFTGE